MERSVWAPISRGDGATVSRSGDLEGLRDLSPRSRVEVLPYSRVRVEAAPGSRPDPCYDARDYSSALGADIKYGISTDLTLDVTIHPDFNVKQFRRAALWEYRPGSAPFAVWSQGRDHRTPEGTFSFYDDLATFFEPYSELTGSAEARGSPAAALGCRSWRPEFRENPHARSHTSGPCFPIVFSPVDIRIRRGPTLEGCVMPNSRFQGGSRRVLPGFLKPSTSRPGNVHEGR